MEVSGQLYPPAWAKTKQEDGWWPQSVWTWQ